ncbi:inner membrane transport protein YhaO, partial [Vibrio parahaemolyticus EKP-021]
LRKVWTARR